MALTFPFEPAFLSDLLCTRDGVLLELMRKDEASGSGDGRVWTAQLAQPLWSVSITFGAKEKTQAREIDAKIRALDGSRQAFLWADALYKPGAGRAAGAGAKVSAISPDRRRISVTGLPADYVVRAGDRASIALTGGKHYFCEFSESAMANTVGALSNISVMPFIPMGVNLGVAVQMDKPILRLRIEPGGHTPFLQVPGRWYRGGALKLLQQV
ncbi:hypothetical protein [Pseudogemmobacter faecipullorum]|uniref:Uncharacterized protein n=1 Tax=Pseudogemmobacter faecipullorum TaxID=2755041 RepID=A0ABS8CS70_9RHOB|nr:hypothetical protein [Pseudogemmobacter faecipullorum]MCB5412246.1 hypothetical protein [Pseudogemmobacter faecipullorum]